MLNECNGCEYQCKLSHIDICTLGSPCPHQRSTPMTEQEFIQTCNTEQLAEALLEWWIDGADTYTQFGLFQHEIDEAKEKIVAWLKQPHREVK